MLVRNIYLIKVLTFIVSFYVVVLRVAIRVETIRCKSGLSLQTVLTFVRPVLE